MCVILSYLHNCVVCFEIFERKKLMMILNIW